MLPLLDFQDFFLNIFEAYMEIVMLKRYLDKDRYRVKLKSKFDWIQSMQVKYRVSQKKKTQPIFYSLLL